MYTHGHDESVLRSHRWRTAENSAAYLLPHLEPGLSLLDVGCGPGTVTVDLAARLATGRVTAVEVTEEALRLARTHAGARRQENIDFVVADVLALDLPDDTFDIVHAHQVLQHMADPDVTATVSTWCFATPGDRRWWGGTWADRILHSDLARQVVASGLATGDDLHRISRGWREWSAAADGWFTVLHGEILCRA
jgi:SAM-dependent methyltransferase